MQNFIHYHPDTRAESLPAITSSPCFLKLLMITIALTAAFTFNSCNQKRPQLSNIYGGVERSSSYEEYGTFYSAFAVAEIPASSDSSGAVTAPLALSPSQIVVATTAGSLLLIDNNRLSWSYRLEANELAATSLCADLAKNIYFITSKGSLQSISSTGKLRWSYSIADSTTGFPSYCDPIALADGIVAGTESGSLFKFTYDGKLLWQRKFPLNITKTFAATQDGRLLIPLTHNIMGGSDTLLMLDGNGKTKWQLPFDQTRLIRTPSIHGDKIYIIGIRENPGGRMTVVYSIDTTGKIIWTKELSITARFISVSADSTVYIVGFNSGIGESLSGIFAFSSVGDLQWKMYYETAIPVPLMISKKNLAFVGSGKAGTGIFFLDRQGNMIKSMSLTDKPLVYPQPAVAPDAVVTFAASSRLCIIKIDDTSFNKLFN